MFRSKVSHEEAMRPKNFRRLCGVPGRSQVILRKLVVLCLRKLGRQSAAAILALREGDGWDFQGAYTFSSELGAYQTTPPYTAIREAARDGNRATEADSNWEPLRTTPPHPDYVSAHSTVCGSSFEILKRTFGDHVSFTMETTTAPPEMPTRSFRSFSAA